MEKRRQNTLLLGSLTLLLAACVLLPSPAVQAEPAPVVAVFLMESRGSPLKADEVVNLTDYLATMLGAGGKLQIIPRDEIRKRLGQAKKESHKQCFDSSCQIELGRELAAQYSISPKIGRVGKQCLITAQVFDLKTSTMIMAVPGKARCKADDLIAAVDDIAVKLVAAIAEGKKNIQAYDGISGTQPEPKPDKQPVKVASLGKSRPLRSTNLALSRNVYGTKDPVKVQYFNTTGADSDWICVVPAGTKDDNAGARYDYLSGKNGAFSVANLPKGKWQARLYLNYDDVGYKVADRLEFHVGEAAPPPAPKEHFRPGGVVRSKHMSLAQRTYRRSDTVEVRYFNTTGKNSDWLCVVPAESRDDHAGDRYDYLSGKDGSFKVSNLPKGDWEARLYLDYDNLGYVVGDRIRFTVK